MENPTRLGERIKTRRRALGMTASHLASAVGITENAVRKIESGSSAEPRFSTGLKIAETLRIAPAQLVGNAAVGGSGSPELATVIRVIRSMRHFLEEQGVEHVDIFGSVARGDAEPGSDVDVIVTPRDDAPFSLINLGTVADGFERHLGRKVDTLTRRSFEGAHHLQDALAEAVRAF